MTTYALFEIDWHDQDMAQEYRQKFSPVLEKFGGKTLCAGPPQVVEGIWNPARLVILAFPDKEAFRAWYTSSEYGPLMQLRNKGATTKTVVTIEGPTG